MSVGKRSICNITGLLERNTKIHPYVPLQCVFRPNQSYPRGGKNLPSIVLLDRGTKQTPLCNCIVYLFTRFCALSESFLESIVVCT